MDPKNLKNIEYMKSPEAVKDSLENLFLFLNEIENIINRPKDDNEEKEIYDYKLRVIEQYISDMNDIFKYLYEENKKNDINVS